MQSFRIVLAFLIGVGLGPGTAFAAWYPLNPPVTNRLTGIVRGPNAWIAVGEQHTIVTSEDGFRWARSSVPAEDSDLLCVTYATNLYVAGGTRETLICTSPDGTNWTVRAATTGPEAIESIAFGNGRFVGVGSSSASAYLVISTNGINWSPAPAPGFEPLHAVAFRGRFFAVGDHGTLITSSNGLDWVAQPTGTMAHLRAASPGSYYTADIAGGDGGTFIYSNDGLTWSAGAPASFDVRGLAADSSMIIGVGNYTTKGRIQVGGATWPGYAQAFQLPLNAVAIYPYYAWDSVAVGDQGSIVISWPGPVSVANAWTNALGGSWEDPWWSLGELPAFWQEQVLLTNAASKTVSITSNTVAGFPNSLNVAALFIDAPPGAENRLRIDSGDPAVGVNASGGIYVGRNGVLMCESSGISATALVVTNLAIFSGGKLRVTDVTVGGATGAALITSNVLLNVAYTISVGTPETRGDNGGTFVQHGGTNRCFGINVGNGGVYELNHGTIVSDNTKLSPGLFEQVGGTVAIGELAMLGPALFELKSGTLTTTDMTMSQGTFSQTGGAHTNLGQIYILGQQSLGTSAYNLTSGLLTSPLEFIQRGMFVQSGGATNRVGTLKVWLDGVFNLEGGDVKCSNLVVGDALGAGGQFFQAGGNLDAGEIGIVYGGKFTLQSGILSALTLRVDAASSVELKSGTLMTNQYVLLNGGTLQVAGTWDLGKLVLTNPLSSFLILDRAQPVSVQFRDSSDTPWESFAQLVITNWNRSLHHVFVGGDASGLSMAQLHQIVFASPAGFPRRLYSTLQLPTGELVPNPAPAAEFSRFPGGWALTWPQGYALYTSTNAGGPYEFLAVTSPYTNYFRDPRRFFLLK